MSYFSDPHIAQFFLSDLSSALGISLESLQNWIARNPPAISLGEHDRKGRAGRGHLLSYQRVLQVALCSELMAFGMGPHRAGTIAATFTDLGGELNTDGTYRAPGELFSAGQTVLCAYAGESQGAVINMVDAATPMRDAFFPRDMAIKNAVSVVSLWVNRIEAQVRAALYR